ncbi:MAG TPA: NF038122 family metalloprotease [Candidatus Krumholzibacteria bacterium]|nr:NF038122 family metalloprotease [Candidatus Krumholzibacteria bacterium]
MAYRLAPARALGILVLALVTWSATVLGADSPAARPLHCGTQILLEPVLAPLPPGGLRFKSSAPDAAIQGAQIVLNAGSGLQAQPAALATWQRAIDIWEGWLQDNVTLTIDADLAPLAAGVLGETAPQVFQTDYTTIRNAMSADAASDEGILAALPNSAQISFLVPPSFTYGHQLSATKANLRALGFDMSFNPAADATMTFSSNMLSQFDFDPTNGIGAGKYDFEAIIVHEIGHVLGFMSEVDTVDLFALIGLPIEVVPRTLDLLRLRPGNGATNFTGSPRVMTSGDRQVQQAYYDGQQELRFATGIYLGDGTQASHWKADELSGIYLGIMDPTIDTGVREELTPNDIRAFGLIGWNVDTDCNGNGIPDFIDIRDGTSQDVNGDDRPDECFADCNHNGISDTADIAAGTEQDCNGNGIPDACEIADGDVEDCNGNAIPDACDIASGASADVNMNGMPDECEPFAFPAPAIDSIDDVPNDQGGAVRMRIAPSSFDVSGSPTPILAYEVYRRIVATAAKSIAPQEPRLQLAGWDFVVSIPAHADSIYNVVVPTLADSTAQSGIQWSVFFLRAATVNPIQYFDSPSDSGYSVDNIAPGVPQGFTIAYGPGVNHLTWEAATETDFAYFRIYRGPTPAIQLNPAHIVHQTTGTSWSDLESASGSRFYAMTSIDDAGNESPAAIPSSTTGTEIQLPAVVQLLPNVPNPFNPSTTLRFALPARGPVRLEIFSAAGRAVRTWTWKDLEPGSHSVLWDGRDDRGTRLASGTYIMRLQAGAIQRTRRVILLK